MEDSQNQSTEESQELDELEEEDTIDPFSAFMFGAPRKMIQQEQSQQSFNYGELMVNIDTLVESARNLKPLVQQVYPMFTQFMKKK